MTCNSTHCVTERIMDFTAHQSAVTVFSGCYTRNAVPGWSEAGILHVQRNEDVLCAVFIERLSGDAQDDFAQYLKIYVAIQVAAAGRI